MPAEDMLEEPSLALFQQQWWLYQQADLDAQKNS
jgi:hypothetical protein